MNVLIIGVNGFLGRAIASRSASLGHRVFGMSRTSMATPDVAGTYVVGNRHDPECIAKAVVENNIDAVVDVIAMTLPDTKALITRLDGFVSQYVMLSSSDVYRNYELLHRKAEGTPTFCAVDERSTLRRTRYPYRQKVPREDGASDKYLDDYDKIPIEEAVIKLSIDWTILRLPMVYGPGDKQRRFRWAIEPMVKGVKQLSIPKAWGEFQTTYGYVHNVAAAIAATIGHPAAARQIFNIAEESPTNHFEWMSRIACATNWRGEIDVTEDPSHPLARRFAGLDLTVPFKIDSGKHRAQIGACDAYSVEKGLEDTVFDEINRS